MRPSRESSEAWLAPGLKADVGALARQLDKTDPESSSRLFAAAVCSTRLPNLNSNRNGLRNGPTARARAGKLCPPDLQT